MAHERSKTTNEERFERFVVPEIDVLLRVARSISRRPADAEDLVQDTLVRAFQAIENFDGLHARAWLMTIMRNAEINRNRRRRPELLDDPRRGEQVRAELGDVQPEAFVDQTFDTAISRALSEISVEFRRAIELVDISGLSHAEAAVILGVAPGTVMSRVHRGRKKIRRYLSDHHISIERADS